MKKSLCLLICVLLCFSALQAQLFVIVSGTVSDQDGPVANYPVQIQELNSTNALTSFTNPNGYFLDTLVVSQNQGVIKIYVANCDGSLLIETRDYATDLIAVSADFEICTSAFGCQANFEYENKGGLEVAFFDASLPTGTNVTYLWSFGDSTQSFEQNPVHKFPYVGVFEVCLSIYNQADSCFSHQCYPVFVEDDTSSADCNPLFEVASLSGNNAVFEALSPNENVNYEWSFGHINGGTASGPRAEHTFPGPGTYEVCLVVWNDSTGCQQAYCKSVEVDIENCTADFRYEVEDDGTYVFTALSEAELSFNWNISPSTPTPLPVLSGRTVRVPLSPGVYEVCLSAFVAGQGNTACNVRKCKTVVVNDPNCSADFEILPAPNVTNVFVFEADVQSADLIYQWTVDGFAKGDSTFRLEYQFDTPGDHEVCLFVYTPGGTCQAQKCHTVNVASFCQADFVHTITDDLKVVFENISHPLNNNSGFIWNFGDGNQSTDKNPVHTYAQPGTYEVCLSLSNDEDSCFSRICYPVTVFEDTAINCNPVFHIKQQFGGAFVFEAEDPNQPVNYEWSFGDGTFESGSPLVDHFYDTPGIYQVCLVVFNDSLNCERSFCKEIQVADSVLCNAHFGYNQTSAGTFAFEAEENDPSYTYIWDFGDGTSDSSRFVIKEFAESGEYEVCLTVFGPGGICVERFCKQVVVELEQSCSANFEYGNTGAGAYVFEAVENNPNYIYLWTFGDGNASDSGRVVTHVFSNPGEYEVCLLIYSPNGDCEDQKCKRIVVEDNSDCDASFEYVVEGNVVNFIPHQMPTVGDLLSYKWDFGDGNFSDEFNPTHLYEDNGLYLVCLTLSNSDSSCAVTFCDSVFVSIPVECKAEFEIEPLNATNTSFKFYPVADANNPNLKFEWSFGDSTTSNEANPVHTYNQPGIYEVCLTVYDAITNCEKTYCQQLTVGTTINCFADFEYEIDELNPSKVYFFVNFNQVSPDYEFLWSFGDGDSASGFFEIMHEYTEPGVYEVCLKIISPNGCTDIKCKRITIRGNSECEADFEYEQIDELTIQFFPYIPPTDQALVYSWTFGDGKGSDDERPIHQYAEAGEYEVCLVVSTPDGSCADTLCNKVEVRDGGVLCDASFGYTENLGLTIGFSANEVRDDLTYYWFFGDGAELESGPVLTHTFERPGEYLVCLTVTDGFSCFETTCQTVNVLLPPLQCAANFSYLRAQNNTYLFFDQSSPSVLPVAYEWNFGDGSVSTVANPTHQYADDGNYEVCLTITDQNGCVATFCQNIGGYVIEGEVLTDGRNVDYGLVYLIYHDPINQTLTAVDTALVRQGLYRFDNVMPGSYLVKAALLPDSPVYTDFLPTYLGDRLFWNEAISVVMATSDVFLPAISLIPGQNDGGPGFIGGQISAGANKTGDPLPLVSVLLLDENGNAVTHIDTDENGRYSFSSLPWGTYQVIVEIPGKIADIRWVTIGPNEPTVNDADFTVGDFSITTDIQNIGFATDWKAYPNPVLDQLKLEFELRQAGETHIRVLNMLGQEMLYVVQVFGQGKQTTQLNVADVPEGVFLLQIKSGQQQFVKKMIKQ